MMKNLVKNQAEISMITTTVKRKEFPDQENPDKPRVSVTVKSLVEFVDFEKTIENFETIRLSFLKDS